MNNDFPPWNWEVYNPKEEDEELDFYKELCPLIANDVEYWCKYELDFEPWKFDKKRREKILKYLLSSLRFWSVGWNKGYGQS